MEEMFTCRTCDITSFSSVVLTIMAIGAIISLWLLAMRGYGDLYRWYANRKYPGWNDLYDRKYTLDQVVLMVISILGKANGDYKEAIEEIKKHIKKKEEIKK